MERQPNTEYRLSLSYGKDSLACLEAIKQLGYPLDRIIHAEVWATDDIPADLPPMVEFKKKADAIIKERYGYTVEHICATRASEKLTYDKQFYKEYEGGKHKGEIYGFPSVCGAWCNSRLKTKALLKAGKLTYEKCFYHIPKSRSGVHKEGTKSKEDSPQGFPLNRMPRCNTLLKRAALDGRLQPEQRDFLKAPLHEGRKQISCSISESPQTSLKG